MIELGWRTTESNVDGSAPVARLSSVVELWLEGGAFPRSNCEVLDLLAVNFFLNENIPPSSDVRNQFQEKRRCLEF